MVRMDASMRDGLTGSSEPEVNATVVAEYGRHVDEILVKVNKLEQILTNVEQFYSMQDTKQLNTSKCSSIVKDKDKDKNLGSYRTRQQDASRRESAASKRMQELMRQFGTILRQITQDKWAGPFMQPVDVVGLHLHDYYEVIEKPMDFSTIKNKMEAKDGSGYKNVREMCDDVKLIFKNAMKYNDERDDVHVMAKYLLEKFEGKWLQLLPKVDEEEKSRKGEEAEAQLDIQLAQDAAHAKMARDLGFELDEVGRHLEELRQMVLQKCRKMSTNEKMKLLEALTSLSPEELNKALSFVALDDPSFLLTVEVDLNIDSLSEYTLWKLKSFVKEALQLRVKSSANMGGGDNQNNNQNTHQTDNKRKKEICDALAKNYQKRSKKLTN